jgi:rare lipoprotein A (peptidoglycan hydrolase)
MHRVFRRAGIFLLTLITGLLFTSSLNADPLIPQGSGRSALTVEKRLSTDKDTLKDGQETVFSFLHGLGNAATVGVTVRNLDFTGGNFQSASVSLIYDIGARRYYSGKASYYGKQFNGRKTSSGETFKMNGISAAHKTLPLGSMAKVTNLENGKSVVVKINDRGPFVKGRELDLSQGAAKKIGLDKEGVGSVEIESLRFANFSLLGGARQAKVTRQEKENSNNSIYYGLTADFRLDSLLKAYAYGAQDSYTSLIEYEAGLIIDLPGSIKAGASYGKHFDNFEGPGAFLQCKF